MMTDKGFATARAPASQPSDAPASSPAKTPTGTVVEELRAAVKPLNLPPESVRKGANVSTGKSFFSSTIVLVVIVAIAGIWLYSRSIARSARLALRAEKQSGNSVLVRWNAHSTAIEAARGGVLLIEDGAVRRELKLGVEQLANGALMYTPQSKAVLFRLDTVDASGRSSSESMQFSADQELASAKGMASPNENLTRSQPKEVAAPVSVTRINRAAPVATIRERSERQSSTPMSSPEHSSGKRPPFLLPPVPEQEVMPQPAPGNLAAKPVAVRINVAIDEMGRVAEAHVIGAGATSEEPLANAALIAARQWTFKPASRDGQPVASQHTIEFRFHAAPTSGGTAY